MAVRNEHISVSSDPLSAKHSAGYSVFILGNGGYPGELERAKKEIDREFGADCQYSFGHPVGEPMSSTLMAYPSGGGEYIVRYFKSTK